MGPVMGEGAARTECGEWGGVRQGDGSCQGQEFR